MVNRLVDLTNMNVDALRVDTNTWGDQFRNAMNVNGGDLESATTLDYFMHFATFAWKVGSTNWNLCIRFVLRKRFEIMLLYLHNFLYRSCSPAVPHRVFGADGFPSSLLWV